MTMLKNVELTETLRAIMSRNTEQYQTDYAEDMQELLYGRQRHYLFVSYELGTLLIPEDSVYYRESWCHRWWMECETQRPDCVRAFAVSVDKRMPGRARGDVYLLNYRDHVIDVANNTVSVTDTAGGVRDHLNRLHEARKRNYTPISPLNYLKTLADAYMTRVCTYRAGFRRICEADARALLNEEALPVYLLNGTALARPLNRAYEHHAQDGDAFGIRAADSDDYDRWQRESLETYAQMLHASRTQREARR